MTKNYSIPDNYTIQSNGNLMGIIRKTKGGVKWLWEPFYSMLLVSKTYGKIMVAYQEPNDTTTIKLSSYNKKDYLRIPIYDILFGENCLWILTDDASGNKSWCLVADDFKGGNYVGAIEFIGRQESRMPFHIPIGQTYWRIKDTKGKIKRVNLMNGEISEDPDYILEKQKEERRILKERPVVEYKAIIDNNSKKVKFYNPWTNEIAFETVSIGDIECCQDLILKVLGENLDAVPKHVAEGFAEFTRAFESYFDSTAFRLIYIYLSERHKYNDLIDLMKDLVREVIISKDTNWGADSGWYTDDKGDSWKVYFQGVILCVLFRAKESKRINVLTYVITEECTLFTPEELCGLVKSMESSDVKTLKIKLKHVDCESIISDEKEVSKFISPYVLQQRPAMAADVANFKYESIIEYSLQGDIVNSSDESFGDIEILVSIGKSFTYRSKKKVNGKYSDWIKTNINTLCLV